MTVGPFANGWRGATYPTKKQEFDYQQRIQREIAEREERRRRYNYTAMRDTQLYPQPIPKVHVHLPERRIVSTTLWCEKNGWQNGHSFSSKDPEKEVVTRKVKTGKTDDYDDPIYKIEEFDICGPCSKQSGLFQSNPTAIEGTTQE